MNYDFNGNITDLKRNQKGYDGFFEEIDELEYGYNGNRLTSVVDHKNNYSGYDTSGNTITYDDNGNMTNHIDKGILEIKYNEFNLPKYIKFNNFVPRVGGDVYQNISYAYRADGVKIKKIHHYFSGRNRRDAFATTEYIDGFQYKNDTGLTGAYGLQFFSTSEGYFDFVNNRYIYHYSDHLGNVRVSFTREGNTAAIVQQNDYYAFGLRYREGINAGGSYKYEYNGKELQEETGMYDYGARFYMPDLGRWGVVDPLAEISRRFTPYHYGNNNPVRFIDPDGRSAMDSFYDYHNFSNENRPMFSTDGAGNMHLNPIYQQNSYIDATGAVGGGILFVGTPTAFGFLQDYFGNGGSVNSLFSMVDQLKTAGWKDPANTKVKYGDKDALLEKIPSLAELLKITKTGFQEDLTINSPAITNGQVVRINTNKISNILSYAFTLGHEMYGHVFANLFFKSKFSEITKIPESSTRTFNFFQEVMGIQWEISMGATRYGNRTAFDAASLFYGPNGVGHAQFVIDKVAKDLNRLMFEWKIQYNIQKNK